jgi:hypothetical protein
MLCLAFFICVVVVWRRRATGTTTLVPKLVMGLALARLALLLMSIATLVVAFRAVKDVPPQDKANALAARIDDSMTYARFGLGVEFPLLAIAWFTDRLLQQRKARAP